MPSFTLNTNVSKLSIPESFITELSSMLADMLGKPEKYVSIHINPDQMMSFAGSTDPCALCVLGCIGKISKEENNAYASKLMDKLNNDLKIDKDRVYINFMDLSRENVAYNGKTFAY